LRPGSIEGRTRLLAPGAGVTPAPWVPIPVVVSGVAELSAAAVLAVAVSGAAAVVIPMVSRLAARSAPEEHAASTRLATVTSGPTRVIPIDALMCLSLPCGIMRRCDSVDRMVHLHPWN